MGRLSVLFGCMFAQKTTELIRRIRRYQSIGYNVLVVNHKSDTRYADHHIITHDKSRECAVMVEQLKQIEAEVRSGDYQVVAIDEGQFFPDLFECVSEWADELPIHIVVVGLDGTSERTPFGDILRLIPHAEEVERLHALCSMCKDGTLAHCSKYIGSTEKDASGVAVGGAELYAPVCRMHYLA